MGRGIYSLPSLEITENHTLAEVAKCCPDATICLLTAARFYDYGSESPGPVWLALERGKGRPSNSALPNINVVWFSPAALESGIETYVIEGVPVRVTSPARTVVDLFRFRHKVGLETALNVLRDALRHRVPVREILQHATRFRIQHRILPYLEALA